MRTVFSILMLLGVSANCRPSEPAAQPAQSANSSIPADVSANADADAATEADMGNAGVGENVQHGEAVDPSIKADASKPPGASPTAAGSKAPPKAHEASASVCAKDSDCRLHANYCGACSCEVLKVGDTAPTCKNPVQCLVNPCDGKRVSCTSGACVMIESQPMQ